MLFERIVVLFLIPCFSRVKYDLRPSKDPRRSCVLAGFDSFRDRMISELSSLLDCRNLLNDVLRSAALPAGGFHEILSKMQ